MDFRYLAIEGPPGSGKTLLAERLGTRIGASLVLDEQENPFFDEFRAGRAGAAFQAQLFSLLARHRQQTAIRQGDLFSQTTIADYLFERDRIYAFLNLDDNELFIYQRLNELLAADIPPPDLVLYLQSPTDVLKKRLKERARRDEAPAGLPGFDADYLRELNEAYNHFFFHYASTPLLVVETSNVDVGWGDEVVDDLLKQIRGSTGGTRYYVPR
ncbi:MAG: deoxynucleoside kinase [Acidobacteria bacterium]|nr:deoxynucleoside kinase [Acidobacteriota bacterium]